jgi:hypothetical protein
MMNLSHICFRWGGSGGGRLADLGAPTAGWFAFLAADIGEPSSSCLSVLRSP